LETKVNYLVLDQYREESSYNDFIGKYYHFPKKYLKQLSHGNIEFIYYEPKKDGKGVYFGNGKIVKQPVEDKRETSNYFVEINDYKPFSNDVLFEDNGLPRKTPPFYNYQNAVRQGNSKQYLIQRKDIQKTVLEKNESPFFSVIYFSSEQEVYGERDQNCRIGLIGIWILHFRFESKHTKL
jgi:hypothetical protein